MSQVSKEASELPTAPKPQFKKLKKKNKARLRTRDNPNDDDNEEDLSAMEAIVQTKKKRKLLNEVLYKKGLDAAATLKPSLEAAVVETNADESKDATERMRAFAGEGGDATAEGGVLQRKHASAMEEFIQENLKAEVVEKETSTRKNSGTDDLFAQLASVSQKLAGTESVAASVGEGDIGAGGAMLGGTGIAEVILPADDRIQTIRETQEAVSFFPTAETNRSSAEPKDSLDISSVNNHVSHVPSSYSHNFQLHTQERAQQNKQQDDKVEASAAPAIEQNEGAQNERMGFEAARRAAKGDSSTGLGISQGKKRSNDDRVWKNFVTREREGKS